MYLADNGNLIGIYPNSALCISSFDSAFTWAIYLYQATSKVLIAFPGLCESLQGLTIPEHSFMNSTKFMMICESL